jgi:hypothetical protein
MEDGGNALGPLLPPISHRGEAVRKVPREDYAVATIPSGGDFLGIMSGQTVTEPERQIPIDATCEVVVAGGGIAGVSAALAAARQGVKVILIERQFGLGGLATLGNVIVYLPLCDGYGKQVMGGIAEELLHRSVVELKAPLPAAKFLPVPDCWKHDNDSAGRLRKRFQASFNPYAFQMEMEQVLEDAGVTLMYDTRVCQVLKQGPRLSHLLVENKSGRLGIEALQFIDATGDADVSFLAGCAVEHFHHNVLASWHYELRNGDLRLMKFSNRFDKQHRSEGAIGPFYSGTDHRDVTRHVLDSRKLLREKLEEKRLEAPGDSIYPFGLPSIPDLRVTRRLHNAFSITEGHRHRWLEDCVGITGDWRKRGPIYPIPLRAIQAQTCPNLFVAGRCVSADETVIDVVRAIGTCAVSGEACGVAAAILVKDKIENGTVPLEKLQATLVKAGALLDPRLIEAAPEAIA